MQQLKDPMMKLFAGILVIAAFATATANAQTDLIPLDGPVNAPDFTLRSLSGEEYTLSELRGKVVIVNFWATWCGPCRMEIPDLSRLHDSLVDDNALVLGISLDDLQTEQVAKFAANYKITYPVLHGPRSKLNEIVRAYGGVEAVPTTFIIGRDGKIYNKLIGAQRESVFRKRIEPLL